MRNKDVCLEIARHFLRDERLYENIRKQLMSIERISKNQTRKPIFTELYPPSTVE
jgi:hypothetical protein